MTKPKPYRVGGREAAAAASTGTVSLLPETSTAYIAKNAENMVEFLHQTIHEHGFWAPSPDLAVYLRQPPLTLYAMGREETNNVWTTTLVLIYCMVKLADYHPYWMKLADRAREWIFSQPYFAVARIDLVKRGSALYSADPKELLASVFSRGGTADAADLEQMDAPTQRGNWVELYLDTPPYSKYFWNRVTNETRWDHPSTVYEPTPAEREARFRAEQLEKAKAEKLAKVLQMRLSIPRKTYLPPKPEPCESCVNEPRPATVFCQACDVYYCEQCCDAMHMHPKRAGHADCDFRFVACVGRYGFPYVRHKKNLA
ncbi:hypothetical protein LEN26_010818 [Aphanomyces euteiches]|nr:hypothetical protein LEN26_010818 [Aphanomyces euteiches]